MSDPEGILTVAAPGGWMARFQGADTKTVLIALIILAAVVAMILNSELDRRIAKDARATFSENHKTTQALVSQVVTNQRVMIEMLNEMQRVSKEDIGEVTYVLTLSQAQRDRLKLEMPHSLRRKLSNGQL